MEFKLPDQNGNIVSSDDFPGKYIILYFYPRDNTPGCSIEAQDFTILKSEFEKNNAIILGVSADNATSHCRFIKKKNLAITLLSDEDKTLMKDLGVWGMKTFMGKKFEGVIRSTFIIKDGQILHKWSPVRVTGHAQEVLEKVKKLL